MTLNNRCAISPLIFPITPRDTVSTQQSAITQQLKQHIPAVRCLVLHVSEIHCIRRFCRARLLHIFLISSFFLFSDGNELYQGRSLSLLKHLHILLNIRKISRSIVPPGCCYDDWKCWHDSVSVPNTNKYSILLLRLSMPLSDVSSIEVFQH